MYLILESLCVEDIDDGADDVGGVAADPVQEGDQPAGRALNVGVEEGEDGPDCLAGAEDPGPDQSHPLPRPHQTHLAFTQNIAFIYVIMSSGR